MKLAQRFEIWGNVQAAGVPANGVRLKVIPDVISATERRTLTGDDSLVVVIPRSSAAYASLLERRVLRVVFDDTNFDEWPIIELAERREADGQMLVAITCADPLLLLGESAMIARVEANGSTYLDFEAPSLTPTQQIDTYPLAALTTEGFSWIARGTVDPTAPIDEVYSWDTPLAGLKRLQADTNTELRLRRNGTTQYLIDLLTAIGSSAPTVDLRFRKNLPWLRRTRMTAEQMTRVYGRGAEVDGLHGTIARARWQVTNLTGAGPYNVTLGDPSGGEGPIAFDDQLNTKYLRKVDGTLIQIDDSVASTQVVQVASSTGIAVGNLVELAANSAGADLIYLEAPTSKATYGLKVGVVDRADIPSTVNIGPNPVMRAYAGSAEPDNYTVVGGATATKQTAGSKWRTGGASVRIQGAGDGTGIDTPYGTLRATAAEPWVSAFVSHWLDAGQVRMELILAKTDANLAAAITRVGTTCTATTSGAHGFVVGQLVEHVGAGQAEYNGIKVVTGIPTSTTYTFEVTGTPTTPSTGTITWARCWRIPNGETRATNNAKSRWVDLGVAGIDAFALGATRAKVRLVQDGATAVDLSWDSYQISPTATQQPFCEGTGGTRLHQAMNRELLRQHQPGIRYEAAWLDLKQLNPTVWAYEDLTLGATANIRDDVLGVTASTRILEYRRELTRGQAVDLVLSTRPDDILDQLIRPRRPTRPTRGVDITGVLDVDIQATSMPSAPAQTQLRLSAIPPDATIYFWLGDAGSNPPAQATATSGAPTATAFGLYTSVVALNQIQVKDILVAAFCVQGTRTSRTVTKLIDKDITPSATLTLSEPVANTIRVSYAPDDDTARVAVYLADNVSGSGWPTTDGSHTLTGPLDVTKKVAELSVVADGGGIDKNGNAIAGAVVPDQTSLTTGHVIKVILVPFDRNGNVGARVSASITVAGAITPALTSWSASRTLNGSACDTTNGAQYTFNWTKNAGVTDGGHDVEVVVTIAGTDYTAIEASPSTNTSKTIRIPFYITSGKWDPTLPVTMAIRLKDSGGTVLQEESCGSDSVVSSCPI